MGRSGELVTNLSGEEAYQSFKPSPLPPNPELNINSDIVKKLVEANRDLVRLDTAAKLTMNRGSVFFLKRYQQRQKIHWLLSKSCQHSMRAILKDFLLPQERTIT